MEVAIFRNIDFNSSNLGDAKDKNTRLKNLILDFSDEKMIFDESHLEGNDIIGDAYMYLVSTFASESGKKGRRLLYSGRSFHIVSKTNKE